MRRNPVQVEAFRSLFAVKVRMGMSQLNAFVEAITQTSDQKFEEAQRERPELIKQYRQMHRRARVA